MTRSVCIFGDSHAAALRKSIRNFRRMDNTIEIDFWVNAAKKFRRVHFKDGALRPDDEGAAQSFANTNSAGRRFLHVDDYQSIVFVGARVDPNSLLFELAAAISQKPAPITSDYAAACLYERFCGHRPYQYACTMAGYKKADIYWSPISLPTNVGQDVPYGFDVRASTPFLDKMWATFAERVAADGITFIKQDPTTVTRGIFTDQKFGLENDNHHKNSDYGMVVLQQISSVVRR
ncbi:MAG: hypothetical protein AAF198_09375 [Pseudomonadota bacterium]